MSDHGVPAHYGVRTKKWKLIYYYGKALGSSGTNDGKTGQPYADTPPEWELFDMEKDPHEMYSLYDDPKYAKVVKELKTEMNRLMKLYKDTPA
jgi:arylsulfatase A-like enzyme